MTTSPYASGALPGGTVVATRTEARTEDLDGPRPPVRDLPDDTVRGFASGTAGTTGVPDVRAAGNATGPAARAGARVDSVPATVDTDAALTAAQGGTPAL
ncbi:hypothetical protein [Streptomyces sp. YIM B13518]|uniref:hypothetical protein n=1 Tax=Streptomyces sp. YIM B13518 TaxID=3366316 RepID=UPI0036A6DB54